MSKTLAREPDVRSATIGRLADWAQSQCAVWRNALAGPEALGEQLDRVETTSASVFLFDFAAGSVSLRQKSGGRTADPELLRRARLYLTLFQDVLSGFELECRFPLAIDVDDHPLDSSGAPMFAFQKLVGSPLLLLPDVDILSSDYFLSPEFDDSEAFGEKAERAIFVGATTGANLTREVVEALSMPRLRSAVFFRDAPDVTFHLPKIVQFDTEETAAMVRALGVCGLPASWRDQFAYRYLLSMDGNGATCSRVAIALKSHSVLIKYASDFQLFYFDGLRPGEHLLSVSRDEDLQRLLAWCGSHPHRAAAIARSGRRFAQEHLSRLPVMTYVACLLDQYGRAVLQRAPSEQHAASRPNIPEAHTVLDLSGHIQNVGETRSDLGGWLGSTDSQQGVEGLTLEPGPGIDPLCVRYRAILADGHLSRGCSGFEFCGTRGQNRSLRGISIALKGAAAAEYDLSYVVAFADGSTVGPVRAGVICRSRLGVAMTGLRLLVKSRRPDLQPG